MYGSHHQPRTFRASGPLRGAVRVPGDKSISHRSLMLSALAVGESRITGLLEGEDVLATAAAMRAMGASIERISDCVWVVHGVGVGGLMQPAGALDMGNSGTSTRLLMGLVASHRLTATFIGDASLSKRPMGRVIDPLSLMGADFTASPGGMLPLMVRGLVPAIPISYRLPTAAVWAVAAALLAAISGLGWYATRDDAAPDRVAQREVIRVTTPGDPAHRPYYLIRDGDRLDPAQLDFTAGDAQQATGTKPDDAVSVGVHY